MNHAVEQLKSQLLTLPIKDRAELATFLLTSLDEEDEKDLAAVGTAWDLELAERMEEMKSGKVVGIPAESVLEEMRRKYP